jgi:RNA-directed DNA polymerase
VAPLSKTTPPHSPGIEALLRTNVDAFSEHVLGKKYSAVKGLIYPAPRYRTFHINKRAGSTRLIREPKRLLKDLQLQILEYINGRADRPKPCVHGFTAGRSIVSNAKQHINSTPYHLLNIDLENFFPSISFYRVRGVFRKPPFNMSHEVATVIAQLCTHQNELPQGAPTSPAISNLVCRSLDRDLTELARRHRATYTRYADDLTFSFSVRDAPRLPPNICSFASGNIALGNELLEVIETRHHFKVNALKTRMSTRQSRMEVTGIKINSFLNVKREFIDGIRGALHAWEKYGYSRAQNEWKRRVISTQLAHIDERQWRRQARVVRTPELRRVVWGRLLYVRMVRGKEDHLYTRLAEKFNRLVVNERIVTPGFECASLPVESIVRNRADAESATLVFEWLGDYHDPDAEKSEAIGCQGTAFAFGDATHLLTCDHILRWTGLIDGTLRDIDSQDPSVKVSMFRVINPTTGFAADAKVVARDPKLDLALLEVPSPGLSRHFVGLETPLQRGESGYLLGFPNWSRGKTVNCIGALVQNRYSRTGLSRIEISTTIRSGNSGGPFVDSLYRVAGVAQTGATQNSGDDECLCIADADFWLKSV